MQGADLLLALGENFDVDGRRGVVRAQGREVDSDASLVVGGAAAVEAAVAFDSFEGGRLPLLEVAGGWTS